MSPHRVREVVNGRRAGDESRRDPPPVRRDRDRVLLRAVRRHVRATSAKLVPAANLDDLVRDGAGFAGFAAGEVGQLPSDPISPRSGPAQFHAGPVGADARALRLRHLRRGRGVALLPAHDPPASARRAAEKGYELKIGLELEYFLLRDDGNGGSSSPTRSTLSTTCYDLRGLTRNYPFLAAVSKYVNGLGWGNYANDHEDANGQFEQNFQYADALTSCDRAIFFRSGPHARAAAGDACDVHAEAVLAPDRQRLPLPHVALGRRHEPVLDESDPAGSASRSSPTTSSAD